MIFSSLSFLWLFLPLSLVLYSIPVKSIRFKNTVLVCLSIFFYTFGDVRAIPIIMVLTLVNFGVGLLISKELFKRPLLIAAIFLNLSVLIFYKLPNHSVIPPDSFLLPSSIPLGISFFTFQNISYLADVYKDKNNAERNPLNYILYILFFPQLIAGPIVKYRRVKSQFNERTFSPDTVFTGLYKFSKGLFKKVIIAETLSIPADAMFSSSVSLPAFYAWLGAVSYSLQIYYDFSGYSDMAIGLAGMFGFTFPENFDHPYLSQSIPEFFRRWHISLFDFFKEYVYIPLGGSRHGLIKTVLNTMIVFTLTGFWHGASLPFIVWGVLNGLIVCLHKLSPPKENIPGFIKTLLTFLSVTVLWVFFRSKSLSFAIAFLRSMFTPNFNIRYGTLNYRFVNIKYLSVIFFALFFSGPHLYLKTAHLKHRERLSFKVLSICFLYISSLFALILGTYKSFIYFKF